MADENNKGDVHDLESLFSSPERDFLVRNNGHQVKIEELRGKTVGLYFSASWCGPCRRFTPKLIQVYNELSSKSNFEVVFISGDEDEQAYKDYFSKMPWLAIPFSDPEILASLNESFHVNGIPCLVLLDGNGRVLTDDAVSIVGDYGAQGYPFSPEKIELLKNEEEKAKKEQTLSSVLVSDSRDFVISNDGNKVRIAELEGKIVGLYFASALYGPCSEFTQQLSDVYGKVNEKGETFKVVLISLDEDEAVYNESFKDMSWLALPCKDNTCSRLVRYFELSALPTLVILGTDGKTVHPNAADLVEEFGVEAYPFTPEKLVELEHIKKARLEAQTLESILVSGDRDFVISKDGNKIPVSKLVGNNILLYFSAHWCPPCRAFLPKLIEAYHEIKAKDNAFEVIFISSDHDQPSFDQFFSSMPWLALPYGDERKKSLGRTFKVRGIPTVIAIGPTGRTVSDDARDLLMIHGAKAYPFTEARLKEIETELEEMTKGWPEKVKHDLHKDHELLLRRRRTYTCDGCEETGDGFAYNCEECDFDLHPKCALEESNEGTENEAEEENGEHDNGQVSKEGWTCDGEVCYRA